MSSRQAWDSKTGNDLKQRNITIVQMKISEHQCLKIGEVWVFGPSSRQEFQWASPTHRTHPMIGSCPPIIV